MRLYAQSFDEKYDNPTNFVRYLDARGAPTTMELESTMGELGK